MTPSFQSRQRGLLALACLVPVIGAFMVSSGLFTIDEFIYLISTDAMASRGSMTVENGYERFASEDLRLWFLVDGPNGLAPQYPPGVAILGTPFYLAFGARGLIVMNSVAAAGVAVLTWRIALVLYADATVAMLSVLMLVLGTFYLDYAWGIWPHMTSVFFMMGAFYLALKAIESSASHTVFGFAAASGLAVGLGMTFRADAILALPIFTACALLYAIRPVLTLLGGALGFLPGVTVLALMNQHKFGTLNFVSYGRTGAGGGDDVTSHLGVVAVFLIALAGFWVARRFTWSRRWAGPGVVAAHALVLVLMLIPATSEFLRSLLRGYIALFLDARTITESKQGLRFAADGSLIFWGVAKKALFQSLPWLGIFAALVVGGWKCEHRRAHLIILTFVLFWSLPFAALSWHGGYSSSMRYFFPMLPALTILGAALVVELATRTSRPALLLSVGAALGVVASFWLLLSGQVSVGYLQQGLNLAVFACIAALVTLASLNTPFRAFASKTAMAGLGFGFGMAMFGNLLVDVTYSQIVRERSAAASAAAAALPGPALFYGSPKKFAFAAGREHAIVGTPGRLTWTVDVELIRDVLASGQRVYATMGAAQRAVQVSDLGFVSASTFPDGSVVEIVHGRDAEPSMPPTAMMCPDPTSWCQLARFGHDPRGVRDRLR